ncbi:hypothetical protein N9V58_00855 [Candidatus Poseidoniales archaeon]|nr:hypothetical protein [Candidatus Poseidoniales archaeon]
MNSNLEEKWLDLVKFAGVSPPEMLSESGVREWARPDDPHPARKNRPMLMRIFLSMKKGNVYDHGDEELVLFSGSMKLSAIEEFNILAEELHPNEGKVRNDSVFGWVESFSEKLAKNLESLPSSKTENFLLKVREYLSYDEELYLEATKVLNKYQLERDHLESLRDIMSSPEIPKAKERVAYIDDFMELVLTPMAQLIHLIEESRKELNEFHRSLAADVVMESAGIQVTGLDFPSLDGIAEAIETLPKFDDPSTFSSFKNGTSQLQIETAAVNFCNEMNERFNAAIELDENAIMKQVKRDKFNIQLVNVYGGSAKVAQSNLETYVN